MTILGSSGAVPAYGRFPSSQLVEIQNDYFLIDCGEGAQMQLTRFNINIYRINHIFISHLHGDHYLGLMGLIFTMHLNHREKELHIYSHLGLEEIITIQFRYSRSVPCFKLVLHSLTPGKQEIIFENKFLTVETIPLDHKLVCSGFLFREKQKLRRIDKEKLPQGLSHLQLAGLKQGHDVTDEAGNVLYKNRDLTLSPRKARCYAYCSDTAYAESIIPQLHAVDLLYHEATFTEADKVKAFETLHSTAVEAATIAKKSKAGKLIIGHFSARYKELDELLNEACKIFHESHLATEGETFHLEE